MDNNQASILLIVCQPDEALVTYNIANDKTRIAKCLGWPADTPRIHAVSAITETLPDDIPESAVIVGGSRHMVGEKLPWMEAAKDLIRRAHQQGKPILGLCFGQQLVCEALGGSVGESRQPEKGMVEVTLTDEGMRDPLFAGMEDTFQVASHHENSVTILPPNENVRVLATSAREDYHALAIGDTVRTLQFHPDISADDLSTVKLGLLERGYFKDGDAVNRNVEEIKKSMIDQSAQVLRNFVIFFAKINARGASATQLQP